MAQRGVKSFLFTVYWCGGVFVVAFASLIFLFLGSESFSNQSRPCTFDPSKTCKPTLATAVFSTFSFLLGAFTSVLSGFLGKKIAINARTDLKETNGVGRTSIDAIRSAAVMRFLLAAIGLLVLYLAINLLKMYYGNDWEGLFEAIIGYGLGGSSMALFGRAVGGIYAMAADICVHLVETIVPNIPKDYRNPAVIPKNVGDIVGDIAAVATDPSGSYVKSSCTALVVVSISSFGIDHDFTAMCYPLLISSLGILVSLVTTLFTANFFRIEKVEEIKPKLERQHFVSLCLMSLGIAIVSWIVLPSSFTIYNFGSQKVVKKLELLFCVMAGLWARQISGFFLERPTNNHHRSVQDGVGSLGLADVITPIIAIIFSILLSFNFAATYGIAVVTSGMLSTVATGLAIDAYGPNSYNAGGFAKMASTSDGIIERIDAFDTAGNTTATSEKGFAVGSAALVSLALLGAFLSRANISPVDVLTPTFFMGLVMGAILSLEFSAMTMKIVGSAGLKMAQQVFKQSISELESGHEYPDYATYIKISTDAAIRGMILPGALVMLIPLIVGTFFGVDMLSGVLAGSLGYVIWIATWASYTGKAWDTVKKNINDGALEHARTITETSGLPFELRHAVEGGHAIGNPQDTSGPPLNILIQLVAVESLVFAPFFVTHGGLLFKIF
ncbi:hypothetical protein BT93_H1213 [Corymbia citriodora subsp. variegata]|nr:hypothetical protein BT93_H1213 [Corymbia citriodora subsp. variegata]